MLVAVAILVSLNLVWDVCELVVFNIAKPPNLPYHHQKHPMDDAPYIGPRLGDDYMYMPQVTLRYTLRIITRYYDIV